MSDASGQGDTADSGQPSDADVSNPEDSSEATTIEEALKQLEEWKSKSRTNEDRAKKAEERAKAANKAAQANQAAAQEFEALRQSQMSEHEKALVEAKKVGAREAKLEFGGQLVAAEMRAQAANRLADEALAVLLGGVDTKHFMGDDGEVDKDAISAFINGIAPPTPPEPPPPANPLFPDLGQGSRGNQQALNGDPLERDLRRALNVPD